VSRSGESVSAESNKISDVGRNALRWHLEQDVPAVMDTISRSMQPNLITGLGGQKEGLKEAEAACRCAEIWIGYGLGGE